MNSQVCKNSTDAERFWRESVKELEGFRVENEGVFVITLDNDRHFLGCHEIKTNVFRSAILFADEVIRAVFLKGVEEFILLHRRPGLSLKADLGSKARARALILAARPGNRELLDYIIVGEKSDKFERGIYSLHHAKGFHSRDPFPAKEAKQ